MSEQDHKYTPEKRGRCIYPVAEGDHFIPCGKMKAVHEPPLSEDDYRILGGILRAVQDTGKPRHFEDLTTYANRIGHEYIKVHRRVVTKQQGGTT